MNNLSLLLLTKNESENLKEWGSWIKKLNVVNEIVVIDDESTDDTIKVINSFASENLKINVYKRKINNDFSAQRNFGLSKCQNDWILSLDADEIPTDKCIFIINHLDLKKGQNYSFKRNIVYLGHTISHGQCLDDAPIKIFNKTEGIFEGTVHEIWKSNSDTYFTSQIILHYSIKNLSAFLEKINQYSTIRAQELYQQKHQPHLWEIIIYPKLKFLDLYFLKLGFLDGVPGMILSLSLSLYSFLVRSKLWHLSQK